MGIFDRWRRRKPDDSIDQTDYDILDEVEPDEQMIDETVTEQMLPGFRRFDDVVETVVEWYEDDVPDVDELRRTVLAHPAHLGCTPAGGGNLGLAQQPVRPSPVRLRGARP
ncbi:hypothetical protein Q9Q99_02695 [Curtobacterium flaccumfaciens]|nr:hypothetical protein Q9Q99_02695 [Curtobacterium flaccumfaciens]